VDAPDFSGPPRAPAPAAAPASAPAPPVSAVGGVVFPSAAPAAVHPEASPSLPGMAMSAVSAPDARGHMAVSAFFPGTTEAGLASWPAAPQAEAASTEFSKLVLVRGGHLVTPEDRDLAA